MIVKLLKADDHLRNRMKLNPAKCTFGVTSGKFLRYLVDRQGIKANATQIKALDSITPPRTVKEVQHLTGKLAALSRFVSRYLERTKPFFAAKKKGRVFEWYKECDKAL